MKSVRPKVHILLMKFYWFFYKIDVIS